MSLLDDLALSLDHGALPLWSPDVSGIQLTNSESTAVTGRLGRESARSHEQWRPGRSRCRIAVSLLVYMFIGPKDTSLSPSVQHVTFLARGTSRKSFLSFYYKGREAKATSGTVRLHRAHRLA